MLIGLTGFLESGKDTTFGFIKEWAEENGKMAYRVAFADKLKQSAANALGFRGTIEECVEFCNELKLDGSLLVMSDGFHAGRRQFSGREYLQWYGTEAHRDVFGFDFWIDQALGRPEETQAVALVPDAFCVVTDVRFDNEARAVRDRGGRIFRVIRSVNVMPGTHDSEVPIDDSLVEETIYNESTLEHLRQTVYTVMNRHYNT